VATDPNETSSSHAPPAVEEKRAALQEVLQSGAFIRAGQLQSFLRFICEMEISGRGSELNEYLIGVEALGRPAGYSPAEDAAVRRRAIDLREKLDEVYATELAASRLRIDLPKGRYVPRFVRVEPAAGALAPAALPAASPVRRGYPLLVVASAFLAGVAVTAMVFRMFPALQAGNARPKGTVYEAEAAGNTLSGTAVREMCELCSGGSRVRRIGNLPANYVLVNDVIVPGAGPYALAVDYVLSGRRSFFLSVNDGPGVELPLEGQSWGHAATASLTVRLEAGRNKIKVYNDSAYAPDLDRLVVSVP
jgi:hypothetical protein